MGNRFASINVFFILVLLQLGFVTPLQADKEKSVINPANKTAVPKKSQTLITSKSKDVEIGDLDGVSILYLLRINIGGKKNSKLIENLTVLISFIVSSRFR